MSTLQAELARINTTLTTLTDRHGPALDGARARDLGQIVKGVDELRTLLNDAANHPDPLDQIAQIGHPMRNALNRAMGHSTIMTGLGSVYSGTPLSPEQTALLNTLHNELERLLRALNRLVTHAKAKTLRLPKGDRHYVELAMLLDDLSLQYELLPPLMPTPRVRFQVMADPRRLREAFELLLTAMRTISGANAHTADVQADERNFILMLDYACTPRLLFILGTLLDVRWQAHILTTPAAYRDLNTAQLMLQLQGGQLSLADEDGQARLTLLLRGA